MTGEGSEATGALRASPDAKRKGRVIAGFPEEAVLAEQGFALRVGGGILWRYG